MTSLFDIIQDTRPGKPNALPGWCELEKAFALASMVLSLRHEISVEIGVYGGSSLLPIALAHKAIGRGFVVGIDPWDTRIAMQEQPSADDREWWGKQDMNAVHQRFTEMLDKYAVAPYTDIIRKESRYVTPPNGIGLLHVDGSHVQAAINDVTRFAPNVIAGGFLVMDDTDGGHGPSPAVAAQKLSSMGFKKLYKIGTGEVYQRK